MVAKHDTFYNSVIQVNGMLPMDNYNHKERETMTYEDYPMQDTKYLNKIVRLRYFNETEGRGIHNRFWVDGIIDPSVVMNYEQLPVSFFIILRWDMEYPKRVIAMNSKGLVLVLKTTDFSNLLYPQDYTPVSVPDFYNLGEIVFATASSREEFINAVAFTDKIHKYPIQNSQYLGTEVYTEFFNDIKNPNLENKFEGTKFKKWNGPVKDDKIEYIYQELLLGDPTITNKSENLLKGWKYFHDRHKLDRRDTPRRAINKGIIIRADKQSGGEIVVMEIVNGGARFVTDKEAYIYTSTTLLQKEKHANPLDFMTIYQNTIPKGE